MLTAAAFLWLLSPIAIAIFLSRTGKFAAAHLASAANFAGLVTYCAWLTGGLSSWLIPWMVAVPLEAALATDRRIVAWAAGVAGLGLCRSCRGPVDRDMCSASGDGRCRRCCSPLSARMSAMAYAAALAVMVQLVHGRSENAVRAGEERYRLLAENATDMITRHDDKGRVIFASLAAQQLFGEPAQKIAGDGLFERVHVADRPAYHDGAVALACQQ